MLISRKHKFIFIHNPKCAGTSIYRALLPYSNFMCRFGYKQVNYYTRKIFGEHNFLSNFRFHISADDLKKQIGEEMWNNYFSFGVVRNPYDRAISNFKYINKKSDHQLNYIYDEFKDFGEYVRNIHTLPWLDHQHFYLAINGEPGVNKILRFENIESDFNDAVQHLNLPPLSLQQLNKSERNDDYLSYYDSEMIQIINEVYDVDFRLFGYEKLKP